jgi:hypothetical protein
MSSEQAPRYGSKPQYYCHFWWERATGALNGRQDILSKHREATLMKIEQAPISRLVCEKSFQIRKWRAVGGMHYLSVGTGARARCELALSSGSLDEDTYYIRQRRAAGVSGGKQRAVYASVRAGGCQAVNNRHGVSRESLTGCEHRPVTPSPNRVMIC